MPNTAQLKLRLKEPLRAKIEAAANKNGVSMNTEMISRLENSFEAERSDHVAARLLALEERINNPTPWEIEAVEQLREIREDLRAKLTKPDHSSA